MNTIIRLCAACEREQGTVQLAPGEIKSHGACRRHAIQTLLDHVEVLRLKPADYFCPDLAERGELEGEVVS